MVGVTPLAGRWLDSSDDGRAAPVALVNASFATALWGSSQPPMPTLEVEGRDLQVVGTVADAMENGARIGPRSAIYVPLEQWPSRALSVVFESSSADPPVTQIREAVSSLEGDVAVREFLPLETVLLQPADSVLALSKLLAAMAAGALLLALCGVYAATSYSVVSRTREIGVRIALGADPASVRARVIGRALVGSLVGLVVGLPVAWGAGKGLPNFIFGSAGTAPGIYIGVTAALLAVSAAAAWGPAQRASSVQPTEALRAE